MLDPYIGTELTTGQMPSSTTRTSAYVRVPFTVTDKDQLTSLALDLRYDDGFIAYLNGRKSPGGSSRRTMPGRSRSGTRGPTAIVPMRTVIVPVTFDLTPYLDLLVNGSKRAGVSRGEQHVAKHRLS